MTIRTAQDLLPEAVLLLGALLAVGLGRLSPRVTLSACATVGAIAAAASALVSLVYLRGMPDGGYIAYDAGLVVDRYTVLATVVLCGLSCAILVSCVSAAARIGPHRGTFVALVLTTAMGGVLLVAAREMIAFYVALEVMSLSSAVLVGIAKTERRSAEAALKTLVLGMAGSATVLYGLAILYGLTGSTVLTDVGQGLLHTGAPAALGIVLVVAGCGSKVGASPFQRLLPDAVEGGLAPVGALLVAVGRTAVALALIRLLVTALPMSASTWTAAVAVVAVVTLVAGTVAAARQTSLRRIVAHLAVAQVGFALMGLVAFRTGDGGVVAAVLCLIVDGVAIVGAMGAISVAEARGAADTLTDYRGLVHTSPWSAVTIAVALVSLVGVPPTMGFLSRMLVLAATASAGDGWFLVIGPAMGLLGAVTALRVLRIVLIEPPQREPEPAALLEREPVTMRAVLGLCTVLCTLAIVLAQPLLAAVGGGAAQIH